MTYRSVPLASRLAIALGLAVLAISAWNQGYRFGSDLAVNGAR